MPELPRYTILRDGTPAGALYDLPRHQQVALHADDPELVPLLESRGVIRPARPPFLDAAHGGGHGAYQPRPQVNVFLAPPIEDVAAELARAFAESGGAYAIEPVLRA